MKKHLAFAAILVLVASVAFGQCLLTYQTESIDAFYVGRPANFQIVAVSGTEPYHFEIIEGSLPEGLHMSASGRIVGMPQAEADTVVFITVTDADGCHLTQAFSIYVFPADQAP